MLYLLKNSGTLIIEVQHLLKTLQEVTFDNIYHEHYNYWSLTSLVNFFKQLNIKIYRAEKIHTHGGSIRVYLKKDNKGSTKSSAVEIETKSIPTFLIFFLKFNCFLFISSFN